MSTEIRLRRGLAAQWTSANPILGPGEAGYETDTRKLKIGDGITAWASLPYFVGNLPGATINDLGDVTITSAADGDFLRWNGTAWVNDAVNLGTDTIGNYVVDVAGGTGVTVTHTPGEASTASIAIGQAVDTNASVSFAQVSTTGDVTVGGNLTVNGTTTTLNTETLAVEDNIVLLNSNVTGSPSTNAGIEIERGDSANVVLRWNESTDSWEVTEDGSTYKNIAVGQDVETSSSVTFAEVKASSASVSGGLTVNGLLDATSQIHVGNPLSPDYDADMFMNNGAFNVVSGSAAGINIQTGGTPWLTMYSGGRISTGNTPEIHFTGASVVSAGSAALSASTVTASTFTGNLVGNADTASQFATARTISLSGDLSGSVSFSGSTDVTLNATVVNSGVALDEVSDVVITSPEEFQSLTYNGTNWVNSYAPTVTYVRNAEATTLTTGTVVYLFGATGDHASVKRADNDSDTTSSKTIGLVAANIPASENGPVVTRGYVDGIDLSAGYTAGDILWLGKNGAFTTTKPSAPEHLVFVGVVVRATSNGIVYVATQNGYEIEELHDVKITSPQNNDFLKYNSASAIWVNDPINLGTDTVGNYMTDVVAGTGVTITHTPGEGSSASIAIGQDVSASAEVTFARVNIGGTGAGGRKLSFEGETADDYETTLDAVDPTADRTIYIPDASGTMAVSGASQNVNFMELTAYGKVQTPRIVSNSEPYTASVEFRTPSANRTVWVPDADGTFAITSASNGVVALGTDTSGNYMADVVAGSNNIVITHTLGEGSSASINLADNVTAQTVGVGRTILGEGYVSWLGSTDYPGRLRWNPTALRDIYLPDVSGSIVTTGDTGTITSTMIANGTITSSDISETAGIALLKLQYGGSGQIIVAASDGMPTWQTITGDISVNASGVASIQANSVELGTDTTGNYLVDVASGTGVTVSHTPGEGSTASISIGQAVDTSSSVTFAHVTASAVSITTNPSSATHAATKGYVDQVTAGINWHESVAYATAAVLPNSPTYANGSADQSSGTGIGATLTATTYGRLQVDGANTSTGQRVLVKNQANAIHNGVYDVTEQGSASVYWVLTRADDSDNSIAEQVKTGDAVYVINGTVNASQGFLINSTGSLSGNTIQIGTDEITWTQFTGTATFTAGTGLSTSGNTINVNTASTSRIVVNSDDIDLATVSQTNTTGTSGISFVQSHSVDSYGRITGTVTADVQDASTSQKGIAQFNSSHFTVSSGSVSIGQAVNTTSSVTFAAVTAPLIGDVTGNISGSAATAAQLATARTISLSGDATGSVSFSGSANVIIPVTIAANSVALGTDTTGNYVATISGTLDQVNVSGSGSENAAITLSLPQSIASTSSPTFAGITISGTASVGSVANISGSVTSASNTIRLKYDTYKSTVALNANTSSSADIFQLASNYSIGSMDHVGSLIMFDDSALSVRSGFLVRQAASVAGMEIGPRVLIDAASILGTPASIAEQASSSVVFYVDRHATGSVGFVLKDAMSSNTNLLEWRDSTGTAYGSIGGSSSSYQLQAISASIGSASISTASVGGTLSASTINTGTASISSNLTVGGNLTVNGTTTTVNATTVTIDDPIFTLGGDTAPTSDDNKDRGIEFRYHSGTAASVGFMGYDDSSQWFTFLVGATNTNEVFSGTAASVNVGQLYINGSQISASDLSNGTVGSGSVMLSINGFTGSGSPVLASGPTLFGNITISSGASVGFNSSASVTLPSKTFFPEEYLTVSSSVTLNSTTHRYATLEMTASAGTSVITVPADASDNFPVGSVIQIIRVGAGEVQVTASAGVTVNNALGSRLRAQWSTATLRKRAANTWLLSGDLKV